MTSKDDDDDDDDLDDNKSPSKGNNMDRRRRQPSDGEQQEVARNLSRNSSMDTDGGGLEEEIGALDMVLDEKRAVTMDPVKMRAAMANSRQRTAGADDSRQSNVSFPGAYRVSAEGDESEEEQEEDEEDSVLPPPPGWKSAALKPAAGKETAEEEDTVILVPQAALVVHDISLDQSLHGDQDIEHARRSLTDPPLVVAEEAPSKEDLIALGSTEAEKLKKAKIRSRRRFRFIVVFCLLAIAALLSTILYFVLIRNTQKKALPQRAPPRGGESSNTLSTEKVFGERLKEEEEDDD